MKCFWIFNHNYTKWETIRGGPVTIYGRTIGYWACQSRTCEDCGKTELRIIET